MDVAAAKRVTAGRYVSVEEGVVAPPATGDWVSRWQQGPSEADDVRRRVQR